MKEKITVVIECDQEKTLETISAIKNFGGKVKSFSVEEVENERKCGF